MAEKANIREREKIIERLIEESKREINAKEDGKYIRISYPQGREKNLVVDVLRGYFRRIRRYRDVMSHKISWIADAEIRSGCCIRDIATLSILSHVSR